MLNLRIKSSAGFWKLSAVLLVAVWVLSGCGDSGRPVEVAEEEAGREVSFAIRLSKLAQSLLSRAEVVITAADMEEIQQELTVSGDLVSGTVKGIPAGNGRLFTLNGYDGEGTLVYTGSSEVDMPAGEVVPVRVTMRRVGSSPGPEPEMTVTLSDPNLFFLPDVEMEFAG